MDFGIHYEHTFNQRGGGGLWFFLGGGGISVRQFDGKKFCYLTWAEFFSSEKHFMPLKKKNCRQIIMSRQLIEKKKFTPKKTIAHPPLS